MGYERTDRRYGYGREHDRPEGRYGRYENPDDRGFFDRAGDEIRSWFGDEDAERRRRVDESYDQDSPGYREGGRYGRYPMGGYVGPENPPRWARSNRSSGRYSANYGPYSTYYPGPDEDRQFGADYGQYRAWSYRDYPDAPRHGGDEDWREREYRTLYGHREEGGPSGYHNWRNRQLSAFDRDYDEYRRENQSRFENEFQSWRQNRQLQRDSLHQVAEHQEVIGSDGAHIGTVDHVRGDRILLTKSDRDAGGHHHSIPSSWIQTVDEKVHLAKTAEQAKRAWHDEENNRGLFGHEDSDTQANARRGRSVTGSY